MARTPADIPVLKNTIQKCWSHSGNSLYPTGVIYSEADKFAILSRLAIVKKMAS